MIGRSRSSASPCLPGADWSEKTIPILYLPGVSRQELRAVAECPPTLMPLAELQYRGAFWSQVNHKDWTVLAFLQSADGGLGLDVARDSATLDAMKTALVKRVATDIQDLTGHRLEATDFHALLSPDPVREILAWMNDPKAAHAKLTAQQWEAFYHSCKDKFGFHPMKHGPLRAAEMLGLRQGSWGQVWNRFREAPKRYPNLPGWLRKAKPQDDDLFPVLEPGWGRTPYLLQFYFVLAPYLLPCWGHDRRPPGPSAAPGGSARQWSGSGRCTRRRSDAEGADTPATPLAGVAGHAGQDAPLYGRLEARRYVRRAQPISPVDREIASPNPPAHVMLPAR